MTLKTGNTFVIQWEPDRVCEQCGSVAECRPYGPNGEQICYECGEKDPDTTMRKLVERIDGPSEVAVDRN